MASKLSSDKLSNKSPKFDGFRAKKLLSSPYAKPDSSPKISNEISKPFYPSSSNEPTTEYICMICLEYLQSNNTCFTSCGHIFHQKCLKLWYKNKGEKTCPLCRSDNTLYNALLPIHPESQEDTLEEFFVFDDFASLQQCVMTTIFQFWGLSTLSKHQPKELFNMATRSLECSQKAFKSGQFLQAYRFLRRAMHFHDGIQFSEHSNIFMKHFGCDYSALEMYFDVLIKLFDLKFTKFFSKVKEFREAIYLLEKGFTERCSTKFTFSL
uniref:RING-type domain-containing protein n=1 Tax=Panagrolaimus superbus TaxID=310955 RepID=A0A914XUN1_9BILA